MIKEAIEHIQAAAAPSTITLDGHTYILSNDNNYLEIQPDIYYPEPLNLTSLDALVKLVRTEGTEADAPLYITVPTHLRVECFSQPVPQLRCQRVEFYKANATDVPGFESGQQMSFETCQIALRTRFQETKDTLYALKLLSDITTGGKVTFNDNGVATSVVTQKGIALQSNESIRPILNLKPYRTFQEVEQPESPFLIRISERGISFTEADGGMWKLAARQTIKAYLEERLGAEVKSGEVVIAL